MNNTEHGSSLTNKRILSIVITVAICVLFIASFITLVSNIIKYNDIRDKKEQLKLDIYNCNEDIEELEYWIKAPMDDDYIMKFAREKLELFRADEVVFTNDKKN